MSLKFFPEDVLFEQRLLSCGGFNPGKLDGQYGPKTRAAEERAFEAYIDLQKSLGAADPRSEKNIQTLLPEMQHRARMIFNIGKKREKTSGLTCVILSGTRTYAEQNRLFKLRPKVTNAGPGQSNHNFGIAIDIGLFKGAKYLTGANAAETKAYRDFGGDVKRDVHDIEWGGDWASFVDVPHYQFKTDKSITQIRKLFEQGASFV